MLGPAARGRRRKEQAVSELEGPGGAPASQRAPAPTGLTSEERARREGGASKAPGGERGRQSARRRAGKTERPEASGRYSPEASGDNTVACGCGEERGRPGCGGPVCAELGPRRMRHDGYGRTRTETTLPGNGYEVARMKAAVVKETSTGERRVALVPDAIARLR